MISIEVKNEARNKIYNSVVTYFDDSLKYTGYVAYHWFIYPFATEDREGRDSGQDIMIIFLLLFPFTYIQIALTAILLCFLAYNIQALGKFFWHGLNFICTEFFNYQLLSLISPFDNNRPVILTLEGNSSLNGEPEVELTWKDQNRKNLYNSFVNFFVEPINKTSKEFSDRFIRPFSNVKNNDYFGLTLFAVIPGLFFLIDSALVALTLVFYLAKSTAILTWNSLNCAASEIASLTPCFSPSPSP